MAKIETKAGGATRWFVFGSLLAAGLYDVWAITVGGETNTISQFMTDLSVSPLVTFLAGLLTCHFFGWTMVPSKNQKKSDDAKN
jgi:vacuolar-type H+-ATPase subunit I/STV1